MPHTRSPTGTKVSVVIPTRNRGADVLTAVRSVLANQIEDLQLIVVDQSSNDETAQALVPLAEDRRLTVLRSDTRGISAARNIGLGEARNEIIALTDDDCEVPSTWCRDLFDLMEPLPDLGIVFGTVAPAPHDSTTGFVPASICARATRIDRVQEMHRIGGMGACMGVRRSVWELIGGFDERLGTGTEFGAGEESELVLRTLLARQSVTQTPALEVVHHGFRTWEQGRTLIRRYWHGTGAALGIHLTSSPLAVGSHLVALGWGWIVGRSPVAESLGVRPHRLARLIAFARGLVAGLPLRPWGPAS